MNRDLTLLLGIEARQKGMEVIERMNQRLENLEKTFQRTGAQAAEAGGIIEKAMLPPDQALQVVQGQMAKVAIAEQRLATAAADLAAANEAAATKTEAAMMAQAAAVDAYTAAQGRLARATAIAKTAQEEYDAALAATVTEEEAATVATRNLHDRMLGWGPKAALVTAATGAIMFSAAKSAVAYNELTVSVANAANISVDSAKKITDGFLTMSTNSKYSAEDLSGAYAKVAGQMGLTVGHALTTKEAMQFMSAAQDAAAASGQSLGSTTTSLSKLMQVFHTPLSQASDAASQLYNASRVTGMGMSQLATMVSRAKSQLGVLAPSIGDTATMMVDLAQHGSTSRQAISTLSQMINKLVQQGKASTPTLQEINNAILAMPKSLQGMARAYANGKISAAQFQAQMKKTGASDPTSAQYLKMLNSLVTKSKQSEKTLNALTLTPAQNEMSKLGLHVFDASGKFVGIGSVVTQLGPKLRGLKTQQEQLRVTQLLFGQSNKKILDLLLAGGEGWSKASNAVKNHKAEMEAAKRAQETFEASMKKLHNTLHALQISIGDAVVPVVEKFMSALVKILRPVMEFIKHNKTLVAVVLTVATGIGAMITTVWLAHKAFTAFSGAIKTIGKTVDALAGGAKKIITFFTEMTAGEAEAGTAAVVAEGGFWSLAASIWATVWPILAVIAAIALIAIAVYELLTHWKTVWHAIVSFIKWAGKEIWRGIMDVVHFFERLPSMIMHGIIALGGMLLRFGSHVMKMLWNGITTAASDVWHFFTSLPGKIFDFLASMPGKMLNFGVHLIESLIHGIGSMAGKLGGAFTGLIKHIPIIGGLLSGGLSAVGKVFSWFHSGGVVPGRPGQDVPAILRAGETVFTADQMRQLNRDVTVAGASPRLVMAGGGRNVVVNVHVNGQVYGSLNDFQNKLGRHLTTTVLPQAGIRLNH